MRADLAYKSVRGHRALHKNNQSCTTVCNNVYQIYEESVQHNMYGEVVIQHARSTRSLCHQQGFDPKSRFIHIAVETYAYLLWIALSKNFPNVAVSLSLGFGIVSRSSFTVRRFLRIMGIGLARWRPLPLYLQLWHLNDGVYTFWLVGRRCFSVSDFLFGFVEFLLSHHTTYNRN